jgi:hypothetical protein
MINKIIDNSPAMICGLRNGDILLSFGDTTGHTPNPISSIGQCINDFMEFRETKSIPVTVLRDGSVVHIDMVPAEWSGKGRMGCTFSSLDAVKPPPESNDNERLSNSNTNENRIVSDSFKKEEQSELERYDNVSQTQDSNQLPNNTDNSTTTAIDNQNIHHTKTPSDIVNNYNQIKSHEQEHLSEKKVLDEDYNYNQYTTPTKSSSTPTSKKKDKEAKNTNNVRFTPSNNQQNPESLGSEISSPARYKVTKTFDEENTPTIRRTRERSSSNDSVGLVNSSPSSTPTAESKIVCSICPVS